MASLRKRLNVSLRFLDAVATFATVWAQFKIIAARLAVDRCLSFAAISSSVDSRLTPLEGGSALGLVILLVFVATLVEVSRIDWRLRRAGAVFFLLGVWKSFLNSVSSSVAEIAVVLLLLFIMPVALFAGQAWMSACPRLTDDGASRSTNLSVPDLGLRHPLSQ